MRVGVVADTHCPEFLECLPAGVLGALAGADLILHLGDVTSPEVLDRLRAIAPVEAVRGDHDGADLGLPRRRILQVGGWRLGLLHGNRGHWIEEPITFVGTLSLGYAWGFPGLDRWLRRQFPDADVVLYGHTHRGRVSWYRDQLLFNPGGVYQITRESCRRRLADGPGWFAWCWLEVARHLRFEYQPTVGILDLGEGAISATIVAI